jgi:hypothetical protein
MASTARHLHWIILAFSGRTAEGNFLNTTRLDIVAESHAEAIERATKLLPLSLKGGAGQGAGYYVSDVIEHFENQPCR